MQLIVVLQAFLISFELSDMNIYYFIVLANHLVIIRYFGHVVLAIFSVCFVRWKSEGVLYVRMDSDYKDMSWLT